MLRHSISKLLAPLRAKVWSQLTVGEHAGILVIDASAMKHDSCAFLETTRQALRLIEEFDKLRFRRVQHYLRFIVHEELPYGLARYDAELGSCTIDFDRLKVSKYQTGATYVYAATLVHEATHGKIARQSFRRTVANRKKVEHLCCLEETRFMRRVNPKLGAGWMERAWHPEGDEAAWSMKWWDRVAAVWRRSNNSKRMPNPQGGASRGQPFRSETNQTSAAAASRPSP
jgi:hypothetical protein